MPRFGSIRVLAVALDQMGSGQFIGKILVRL